MAKHGCNDAPPPLLPTGGEDSSPGESSEADLVAKRAYKQKFLEGVALFNKKPKKGRYTCLLLPAPTCLLWMGWRSHLLGCARYCLPAHLPA